MPGREIPLVNEEIYHILNRGVASQPIFLDKWDYKRAIETMLYYQNIRQPQKYSTFIIQAHIRREQILMDLKHKGEFLVEIIAYCFMPNHFHFLLKQIQDGGISKFLSNFSNSYTRYFNTKHKRLGPLFQGKFKSIRIETDEQLLHLSRYTHLNPYTSYVVKTLDQLLTYPFSSLPEYLNPQSSSFCHKKEVLSHFKKPSLYLEFLKDQADYQRRLDEIKHLTLEA